MKLFHRDVMMPEWIRAIPKTVARIYHSTHASSKVTYFNLPHRSHISFDGGDIVEAAVDKGKVAKLLVRLPYSETKDICYVIVPVDYVVVTVFLNDVDDHHPNLERWRYDQ